MVELVIPTAVYEGSLKDLGEIEAFCAQHELKKSAFFAAALSIVLHRYLEKDILHIAINCASEQKSSTAETDVWRMTLSPEMAIQDLFEDRKSMALAQEYAETERESTSGRRPTREEEAEASTSELPMSSLDAFLEQYGFLHLVTNNDAVTGLKLHLRTTPLLEHHGRLIAPTFAQVAQQILAHPGWKIKDLDLFSPDDIDTVSQWNQKHVFQPESRMMAEIVHQQSLQRPDSLAIRAWDGELTYGQLDDITNRFSAQLQCEGVGTEVLVPVCFEKSLWAIVAELGILKAGGAFVPTNPSQPPDQLKHIIEQTKATLIVASAAQSGRLYGYGPKIITLSPSILSSGRLIDDGVPPVSIDAHSAAYVLFTSGSTGKSKGCVVNQSALADIARHCEALYLSPKSRVLQFASYTFGVSLIEIFCSLTAGATICIPSEEERLNNLAGYMTDMEINWAFLTPSTVNSIDDSTLVPQLEILILAGEPMSQHHVETWAHRLELYQAYGLTEWAGICGVSLRIKGPGSRLESVGLSSPTANAYLVEPADHNKLAPIGAVAELLLEGPSLARGYLNDPIKTASTFIDPPAWLSNLRPRGDGRVYKTGDLVRYQSDGSFRYLSRKDTQVKIRGKRLELGEVEYCVCQHCPLVTRAIAEAVVPNGSDETPILLVFLFYQTPAKKENDDESDDENGEEVLVGVSSSSAQQFRLDVEHLKAAMPQFLPEHMVPAIYLPLQYIPLTLTGKIDRRKLRERMCQLDRETLESYSFEEWQCVPPVTKTEITLHKIFAQILNVQPHKFGIHDSFLRLGGDSVKAMRLARVCQAHGLSLTVKDVLEIQTVTKLASFSESKQHQQPHQPENGPPLRVADDDETSERSAADSSSGDDETNRTSVPNSSKDSSESSTSDNEKIGLPSSSTPAGLFPLLALGSESLDQLVTKRLPELGISADRDVEDAFPCAPIQEGILLSQARQPENYEMRFVWEITPAKYGQPIDIGQLQRAWRQLIKVHPMLRTIFIEGVTFDAFAIQVILTEGVPETAVVQCEATVPNEVPCPDRLLGQQGRQSLPQLTIYQSNTGQVFAMLDINHAVTDATSMSILMRDLARFYDAKEGEYPSQRLHYSKYISYLQNSSSKLSALIFWKSYLAEVSPCIFPQLNLQHHSEGGQLWQSVSIDLGHVLQYKKFRGSTGITLANLFKLAWGLVLRSFTASSKICFGYMTSGRDVPLLGIEDAVGPFINMLLCCLDIVSERSLLETLQSLQSDFIDALPHQRVSLAEIRHSLNLAGNDALFNTTLTFPPQVEEEEMASINFKQTYLQDPGEYDIVIEVSIRGKDISATMKYWTHTLSGLQAHDLASTLSGVISQILDRPRQTVGEIQMLSQVDKEKISQWNKVLPQTSRLCVHELIDQQCVAQPDAAAVCAWDGCLTYRELQDLSIRLALHLVSRGVKPGAFVPLCLSKSCWTPVAMLAVVKAGGAFVLLDPSLPLERQQEICNQLGHSPVIITSAAHRELAASLVPGIVMAENGAIPAWPALQVGYHGLPSITSNDVLYAVFTSGSTGQPKGVVVEHGSYSTNAMVHTRVFNLTPNSRTLQFSGYSFDVSIFEHLTVLIAGGCLCIPSESDRYNQLAQVAARMEVNSMFLTPSVARMLSPKQIPTLKTLALVGEPMHQVDINTWPLSVRLINGYGPAESTIFCSIQPKMEGTDPNNIGWPTASAFWVTNPDDPHQLIPVGAVGELLIEGPILARCYLNDPEKTAASFIKSPKWLQKFRGKSIATEESRLYRTGDLVKYTPLGSLRYLGRKDTQVKLHGQRFELADVEHHVRLHFKGAREVVADVVRPGAGDTPPILIALVARSRSWGQEEPQGPAGETLGSLDDTEFLDAVASTRSRLYNVLPSYMVPTIFFPLNHVPLAKTGKADRRLLRQLVTGLCLDKLDAFGRGQVAKREPASAMEWALRGLFAKVLALNPEQVSAEDHFFRLRGDSISAMKLVGEARQEEIYFSVADVFSHPVLCELAKLLRNGDEQPASIAAFTLLPGDEKHRIKIQRAAAESCSLDEGEIDDIYPCTALQEGLMSLTAQNSGMYIGQLIYKLTDTVDLCHFQAAWQSTLDVHPILRTRIIQTEADRSLQVVVKQQPITWRRNPSLEDYLTEDIAQRMMLGQPLARFALIQPENCLDSSPSFMVLTLHHALYDGWSLRLILRYMNAAYHGTQIKTYHFAPFIKFACTEDTAAAHAFWLSEFTGLEAPLFPALLGPAVADSPGARCTIERSVPVHIRADASVTLSNMIRLALAIVISAHTDCEDVVFGVTLTGRNAPLANVEDIAGPTFTTVPFRIRVVADEPVEAALAAVQEHAMQMIPFEQTGLQNIRKISPEAAAACGFRTHLGVQLAAETADPNSIMQMHSLSGANYDASASYPLVFVCGLTSQNDIVHVNANFDPSIVSHDEIDGLVAQFSHVLQQLRMDPTQQVGSIELVSPEDLKQLHQWNSTIPAPCFSPLHDLVLQHARERPMAVAVSFASSKLTFGDLDVLSAQLAQHIAKRGVEKGSSVPLCFEKSAWPVVAMMAVLRVGGTCVNIDAALPPGRVRDILREVAPKVALSSPSRQYLLENCAPGPLIVLTVPLHQVQDLEKNWISPVIEPHDAAFIVFTSGSTGKPKGIILEHMNLSTSIHYHSSAMVVDQKSQSLHFANYAFDASIYEIFTTLVNGGCIHIPSESERVNDMAGFIHRHNINWALLTPSVISLLRPEEVPNLHTLVLGGEAVTPEIADVWAGRLQLINAYGPAEATICAAGRIPRSGWRIGTIGPMLGSVGWVTMPSDPNRLAPLGAVGELLIEGSVIARKYLNQSENQSLAGFIQPPPWLSRFRYPHSPGRIYQSGDLVQLTKDGQIRYAGRKDTQVKLHGQRIELGEVEHYVRSHFEGACEVIADVITRGAGQSALLLAFIWHNTPTQQIKDSNSIFALPDGDFQQQANKVRAQLQETLPPYMVPAVLLPLRKLPLTPTGKTDRRRLREEASRLSSSEYELYGNRVEGPRRVPSTETEIQLQQLWVRVLKVSSEDVEANSSFFHLGGNSIDAMLLVSVARQLGLELSVADVFKIPKLCDLAVAVKKITPRASNSQQPCSLFDVTDHETFIREEIAAGQPFQPTDVIDVLPTTEFQRQYLRGNHHYFIVMIPGSVHPTRMAAAIRALVEKHEILRTVFLPLKDTIAQVTLHRIRDGLNIVETTDVKTTAKFISEQDAQQDLPSGTPIFQATLIVGSDNHHALILRISHAQYDGVSLQHLYTDLTSAYQGNALAPTMQFSDYMKCRVEAKTSPAWNFWKGFLQGSCMTYLDPHSLGGQTQPASQVLIKVRKTIKFPTTPTGITMATVFKAAWALILARSTQQQDIVFGQVVNGRGVPLDGVEKVLGACVNIVPVRVIIQPQGSALALLRQVQDQHIRTLPFETTDLEEIVRQSTPWSHNTRFGSIAQHQNILHDPEISFDGMKCTTATQTMNYLPDELYAVSVPQGQNLIILIIATNKMLSAENADGLLGELAQMVLDLTSYPSKCVSDLMQ